MEVTRETPLFLENTLGKFQFHRCNGTEVKFRASVEVGVVGRG